MARRGRKVDPEKEFKKFMNSMEEFLHRGQYPSLTILMEGILNSAYAKRKGNLLKNIKNMQMETTEEILEQTLESFI